MELKKDWYRLQQVFEESEEREDIATLGGESFTLPVFEANWRSKEWPKLGLALKWTFEKGNKKSDSYSKESEYKNKLSSSKDWQKPERHIMQTV